MQRVSRAVVRVRGILIIGATLLVCSMIWWNALVSVLMTVFSAVVLALILLPLVLRLETRMSPGAAAGLAMLLLSVVLLLFLGLVFPAIAGQVESLVTQLPALLEQLNRWIAVANEWLEAYGAPPLPDITQYLNGFDISILVRGIVQTAGGMLGRIAQWLLIPMMAFYFLRDRDMFCHALTMLIPVRYRRRVVCAASETRRALLMYLRGHALVSLFIGGASTLGLLIIGVNSWLALGVWIGLTDIIPYFGPMIGIVPVVLLGPSMGWQKMLWSVGLIFVLNQVEGNWLHPRVVGDQTGIHPVTVLVALTLGNLMFGILGLILSLPILIAGKTIVRAMRAAE